MTAHFDAENRFAIKALVRAGIVIVALLYSSICLCGSPPGTSLRKLFLKKRYLTKAQKAVNGNRFHR